MSGETAMTAMKNAISNHRCDAVKQLAEIGCDINMADGDGWCVSVQGRNYVEALAYSKNM